MNETIETIEKRLKDYKGYQVWKITDNKGTRNEKITYMLNDDEDNNNKLYCGCDSDNTEGRKMYFPVE